MIVCGDFFYFTKYCESNNSKCGPALPEAWVPAYAPCGALVYMYMYNCDFFFPSVTSLRARTFVPKVGWGGHNSTVGLTLPEV